MLQNAALPEELAVKYELIKKDIITRLGEFSHPSDEDIFYELCYCICTPQSAAKNAFAVEMELKQQDFLNKSINPVAILRKPESYIRFHNQKSKRLLEIKSNWKQVLSIVRSEMSPADKRNQVLNLVNGFGMKESSHFLRNTGTESLAILDRHILKCLVGCGLFKEVPKVANQKNYLEVEWIFQEFAEQIEIPIDHLDLLFWAKGTGEILK